MSARGMLSKILDNFCAFQVSLPSCVWKSNPTFVKRRKYVVVKEGQCLFYNVLPNVFNILGAYIATTIRCVQIWLVQFFFNKNVFE